MKDAASDDAQGQLYPASEVKVVGQSGDMLKVEITGWEIKGSTPGMLVQDMAKQIQTASIDPELQKTQKVLNTQTATDGAVWQQVQVAAWMTQLAT
ncbi:hypothetical protein [Photobacterium leiognathi]|uniref:hypothetical protein n=1 Tax=Photobacterium leiognathi TaxID=553611 RepID=UPI00273636EE|nr:hypothetical protein [Photobacterium leiognathi]